MKLMRFEALLAGIAISMSFVSGYLVLTVRNSPGTVEPAMVESSIRRFARSTLPQAELRSRGLQPFFDPRSLLPRFHEHKASELRALLAFETNCKPVKTARSAALAKAWAFAEHRCGQRKSLPEDFFSSPPIFHPAGKSFAILHGGNETWNSKHAEEFHVLEAAKLGLTLAEPRHTLSRLPWPQLHALARGDETVQANEVVFLRRPGQDEVSYSIFPRAAWDSFWRSTPFNPHTFEAGAPLACFVRQGDVCWLYDAGNAAYLSAWSPALVLLALSLAATVVLFLLLAHKIRRRQADEERLKFTLEMLTHELRTPLTSLSLNIDRFRPHFDELPPPAQSFMLRIFDQVERLRRVAESSTNYLAKDLGTSLLAPKISAVSSLEDFVRHTLEPFENQIELILEGGDGEVRTDPFWVSVCLKNLVENALRHGVKPVRVRVRRSAGEWSFEVEDQGSSTFDPGVKGAESRGLGIGFGLVKRIAPLVHGRLELRFAPTRVSLEFREET